MIPLEGWIGEKIAFPVVVSGPSGVGKTSLVDILLAGDPDSVRSISATTRTIRENEVDGRDYFYVGKERFLHMKEAGELVESAVYVAEQYGTPKSFLEERIAEGKSVILNIEVQGGLQVRSYDPASVLIFVIPPSWEELRRRLMNRGTETAESIEERIRRGREELTFIPFYDYVVINDTLDRCAGDMAAIIRSERRRRSRIQPRA